jgi:DNA polymerase I-like protein with 3'-5' exonuclease and polymerase domains
MTMTRLHSSFLHAGTVTGRLASCAPNLQNLPRGTVWLEGSGGINIRRAFVARPGCVFVAADFDQLEIRILAHLANDEDGLLRFLSGGGDPFSQLAADWLSLPPGAEVAKEDRQQAKGMCYGIIYGMGPAKLAADLSLKGGTAEAKRRIASFHRTYPAISAFARSVVANAKRPAPGQLPCVRTLHGRRRVLPDLLSKDKMARALAERQAVNAVIQGTAADLIKLAMVSLHAEIEDFKRQQQQQQQQQQQHAAMQPLFFAELVLQVHDELVFEVEEAYAAAVGAMVRRAMEGAAELRVALNTSVKVGPTLGDLQDLAA